MRFSKVQNTGFSPINSATNVEQASKSQSQGTVKARARKTFEDSTVQNPASAIFNLSGELSPAQVQTVTKRMRFLSDRQIKHLAANTDLATKSPRFAAQAKALDEVFELTHNTYWHPQGDDRVRLAIPELAKSGVLTPAMTADLMKVLLAGPR